MSGRRRRGRIAVVLVGIALGIVLLPVALAWLAPQERRALTGVPLSEARFKDVTFHNRRQGLKLAGMMFRPEGEGPFPAAVIIQGSGTSRRDNPWYLALANYLQENGIVVLLPDKRGSARSEGDWRKASFEDLTTDALAALEYLDRPRPRGSPRTGDQHLPGGRPQGHPGVRLSPRGRSVDPRGASDDPGLDH